MKKYILCPGTIRSTSGEKHKVSAVQLARLYGVDMKECIVVEDRNQLRGARFKQQVDLIHLYPRQDGEYVIPKPRMDKRKGK